MIGLWKNEFDRTSNLICGNCGLHQPDVAERVQVMSANIAKKVIFTTAIIINSFTKISDI